MRRLLCAFLLILTGLATPARADDGSASDWAMAEAGGVRLLSAATASGQEARLRLGLDFDLRPGWKIYWRTPGDAGYPPKLDWTGSDNLGDVAVLWPAPHRFELAGLQNHGYAGRVILPLDAPIPHPGQPVQIRLTLDYLACAKICVPMQAKVSLDLPAGPAQASDFAHDIDRFAAQIPGDGARHGLRLLTMDTRGQGDDSVLRVVVQADPPLDHPDIFVEPAELASFDAPVLRLEDGGRRAILESKVVPGTLRAPLAENPVTVTLVDGLRSMEVTATPQPAPQSSVLGGTLAAMAAVAALGGLILNLMPCVLPVLSIKVLGALGHGGGDRGHIRAAFLASAAGILVSFWLLGGAAIGLKLAGQSVGWGIQFQQPVFLAAMIAILLLFALNLWGLFEIPLPGFLSSLGGNGQGHHTVTGHFLSGVFATLLATPCSAPFLGTAVGFALAQGPVEIGTIFTALGLGMAGPYLAVALYPGIAQRLPRPGAWMIWVKRVMGVALAATALWLGGILATQTGLLKTATDGDRTGGNAISWIAFDPDDLTRRVQAGQVIFVDVTADWCITCKVNKATVIDRGEVAKRLSQADVVAIRADWTKPDSRIAAYLASFGRFGIPFNAVYGPKAPQGIPLSELPSEAEILAALDRAR